MGRHRRFQRRHMGLYIVRAPKEFGMADILDPLVLDLIEWIAREPRSHADVIDAWRTSCPRLTVGEDANDRGYVIRKKVAGSGGMIMIRALGKRFLQENGRLPEASARALRRTGG